MPGVRRKGRLELTWTNKDWRLLVRDDGTWEWVPTADYRVAEIRLLHKAASVGVVGSSPNLLIRGDALHALSSLATLPPFAERFVGGVKLAYLDPPFNTQQAFEHYDDALEHSVWLTMMRDRLLQIRTLLAPDGSVWAHCDDSEQAYLKVMMDEVFGRDNFVATVIWEKADTLRNDAKRFSGSHDYLIVFAKSAAWLPNRLPRSDEMNRVYRNPDNDPRGPWLSATLISPSYRVSGDFEVVTPSGARHRAPEGTSWRVPRTTFDALLADNRIWFGRNGSATPQRKLFLSEAGDRVVDTVWHVKDVGGNRQSKAEVKALFRHPFDTPKPERLMQRIVHIASNPGDLVLDCFAGSGTTAAVAHKMGRPWVAVERSRETVETFTQRRLERVVGGDDSGGVTEDVGWEGGGGFLVCDVAASMFEVDSGQVVLAEWATNGALAEATAAQLRFSFEDSPPFAGRKGRSRLAVIDGHVTPDVVRLLLARLDDGERLTVCGTSFDPEAVVVLKAERQGSRVKKIPDSLLAEYQDQHRWRPSALEEAAADPSQRPSPEKGAAA